MTQKAERQRTGYWRGVPDALTLLRVILTCYVHYYMWAHFGRILIPLLITAVIFLTDYMDGKIARKNGTMSPSGAVFDLLADFYYILLAYLLLYFFQLIPCWFLFLVLFKFLEFATTSFYLKKTKAGNPRGIFTFDVIGKLVAATFYFLPILFYCAYWYSPRLYSFCVSKLLYSVLFLSLLSSGCRIWNCCRRKPSK